MRHRPSTSAIRHSGSQLRRPSPDIAISLAPRFPLWVAVTLALAAGTASADPSDGKGTVSGTVSLTNDYVARGQSQTGGSPALQGSLGWTGQVSAGQLSAHPYASIWASNIDFDDGSNATVEVDYQLGLKVAHGKTTMDVYAIYYAYPGAKEQFDLGYVEAGFGLELDLEKFTLSGSFYWSPEYSGANGDSQYYALDLSTPLSKAVTLDAHAGYNAFSSSQLDAYTDWSVALTRSFARPAIGVSISYVDSDLACGSDCGSRALIAVSASF